MHPIHVATTKWGLFSTKWLWLCSLLILPKVNQLIIVTVTNILTYDNVILTNRYSCSMNQYSSCPSPPKLSFSSIQNSEPRGSLESDNVYVAEYLLQLADNIRPDVFFHRFQAGISLNHHEPSKSVCWCNGTHNFTNDDNDSVQVQTCMLCGLLNDDIDSYSPFSSLAWCMWETILLWWRTWMFTWWTNSRCSVFWWRAPDWSYSLVQQSGEFVPP